MSAAAFSPERHNLLTPLMTLQFRMSFESILCSPWFFNSLLQRFQSVFSGNIPLTPMSFCLWLVVFLFFIHGRKGLSSEAYRKLWTHTEFIFFLVPKVTVIVAACLSIFSLIDHGCFSVSLSLWHRAAAPHSLFSSITRLSHLGSQNLLTLIFL